jgi:hypothetical protein
MLEILVHCPILISNVTLPAGVCADFQLRQYSGSDGGAAHLLPDRPGQHQQRDPLPPATECRNEPQVSAIHISTYWTCYITFNTVQI